MNSGPLNPGPNPSANMSYARRTVVDSGAFPLSPKPKRIEASGAASTNNIAVALSAAVHGRR